MTTTYRLAGSRGSTTSVIVVPWYERRSFERIQALSTQDGRLHGTYESWVKSAEAATQDLLREGRVIHIVTIRADDYLAWLEREGRTNSARSRGLYILHVAETHGGDVAVLRKSPVRIDDAEMQ
jgi:hypothetical protein